MWSKHIYIWIIQLLMLMAGLVACGVTEWHAVHAARGAISKHITGYVIQTHIYLDHTTANADGRAGCLWCYRVTRCARSERWKRVWSRWRHAMRNASSSCTASLLNYARSWSGTTSTLSGLYLTHSVLWCLQLCCVWSTVTWVHCHLGSVPLAVWHT